MVSFISGGEKVNGSDIINKNGRGNDIISELSQSHDYIDFFVASKKGIIQRCNELYQSGLSLREITNETGIPKTTVIESLYDASNAKIIPGKRQSIKTLRTLQATTKYGEHLVAGKLIPHEAEQSVIKLILKLNTTGLYWRQNPTI